MSPEQRRAVTHPRGPLIVIGGAGTGKTTVLAHRFAWLVEQGAAPEEVLAVTHSERAADALRLEVEALLDRPYEELPVLTVHGVCSRLLHDEAIEAGIDPFVVALGPADRTAMLLERIDELTLRRHDLRGNPAALLRSVVARIDRLKDEAVTAAEYDAWARALPTEGDDAARTRAEREREFAGLYLDHDRMLAEAGALDAGDLLLAALSLLRDRPHVRARVATRWRAVLVDDYHDLSFAQALLVTLLASDHGQLTVTGDDDQAIRRFRGAAAKNLRELAADRPDATEIRLERSMRCPETVVRAAEAVVAPNPGRIAKRLEGRAEGGRVEFWRCAGERAQAQAVAAEAERLLRAGTPAERIAVLVRGVRQEGRAVAVALEERSVPYRVEGAAAFFARAEVRDVLAWLRLLVDPSDAGAVVRALARPPIELRAADLARCIQISRRRKLDMVSALVAATESPQLPPEARERVLGFLKLHRQAAIALDTTRADLFVHRLVERLGLRRQQLFAAQADVVERLRALARLSELASDHVRRRPQASARDLAKSLAAVAEAGLGEDDDEGLGAASAGAGRVRVLSMDASTGLDFDHVFVIGLHSSRMPGARRRLMDPIPDELVKERLPPDSRDAHNAEMRRLQHVAMTRAREGLVLAYSAVSDRAAAQPPSPFAEEAREALDAEWQDREEELFGPAETLHSAYRALRDELLADVPRVGASLGELRFDTDLDVAHAVTRYLELVKLAALLARPPGQTIGDALPDINARLIQAVTPLQREILLTSSIDEALLDAEHTDSVRATAQAARAEPSLEPFLPKRGEGLVLSASDIDTYRICPLRYKFARVFRIPSEPTINQRFGILVHQVLERYHRGDPGRFQGPASGGHVAPSGTLTGSIDELFGLLDAGWRRGGFGDSDEERQLHEKAVAALDRYHARFRAEPAQPVWFEKPFTFRMGRHTLRGRVDRVDKLPDGRYELIDYKTGRPKSASQLREDVQLSLYAVGAREAWQVDAERQSYLYVLDDEKVPVPTEDIDRDWISETVLEVADGILGQGFEPTPSYAACSSCDYRIACPAAER